MREPERDENVEKTIPTDSEVILRMEEEIDDVSGETRTPLACSTFCRPSVLSFHSDIALQLISPKSPHVAAIYSILVQLLYVATAGLAPSNDTLPQSSDNSEARSPFPVAERRLKATSWPINVARSLEVAFRGPWSKLSTAAL